jgi:sugar (pentulose or hexulose) kinase
MEENMMNLAQKNVMEAITHGNTALGIEFGSTRIKAVLIDETNNPIASGSHEWENSYVDNIWTYRLEDIWKGLQDSYAKLVQEVKQNYNVTIRTVSAIGFSAMMHGYMVFDQDEKLLVPFRTWRNTITEEAAKILVEVFHYPIPQRWSIAHLYQAILGGENHVENITYMTTLAGYIHWKLTGEKILGVGDASGMFPIDVATGNYYDKMIRQFNDLIAEKQYPWKLEDILPKVLAAGQNAGFLTEEGSKLLDISGELQAGIPLCPPEGDAGTGMVATNSVAKRTGNVSAGTSVFSMVVLEKELTRVYSEIDLVTTPTGNLVGMAHSNNCTSDLNAWIRLFQEFTKVMGMEVDTNRLFETLYHLALQGDADGGGLLAYGYQSSEHITHVEEGRPLFVRTAESKFTLANFMRVNLNTALGALKIGMDILLKQEGVRLDKLVGHGGLFKTKDVGQKIMAAAIDVPVSVLETAGEGGAWGAALLASYMKNKAEGETLEEYLSDRVFTSMPSTIITPDPKDVAGYKEFMKRYIKGLAIEYAAGENL